LNGTIVKVDKVTKAQITLPVTVAKYGTVVLNNALYQTNYSTHRFDAIDLTTYAQTTVYGTCGQVGNVDGIGAAARFSKPADFVTDGTDLYLADKGNGAIKKITVSTGQVTTLISGLGSGLARMAIDKDNIYFTSWQAETIRKYNLLTNVLSTIVLFGTFNGLVAITTDGTSLYVTDSNNLRVKVVN